MGTENYSNDYKNWKFLENHLKDNQESEAWVCGVLDFLDRSFQRRIPRPFLDYEIRNNKLFIFKNPAVEYDKILYPFYPDTDSLYYDIIDKKICIFGDTYDFKEILKSIGGRWDPNKKCWYFSPVDVKVLEKINQAIADAGVLAMPTHGETELLASLLKSTGGAWDFENQEWEFHLNQDTPDDSLQKIYTNITSRKEEHFGVPWNFIFYPGYKKWINDYRSGKSWANENGHKLEKTTTKW